jgi:CubicO group peptidase (beta-lactamase class C family)
MSEVDKFASELTAWVATRDLPGVQYHLAEQGKVIAAGNLGYKDIEAGAAITAQSLFRLASASKLFVSVAFLRLVESGQIKLSDPVSSVFPEYRTLRVFHTAEQIAKANNAMTMLDLLRHSCGYGYGDAARRGGAYRQALLEQHLLGVDDMGYDHWRTDLSLVDWARALAQVPMEDEPGTRVCYGLGHDLAGAVIEAITGQSLANYFTEALCQPLGLTSTFFVVPESRAADLTAFYQRSDNETHLVETGQQSEFLSEPRSFSGGGGWDMLGNGGLVSNVSDFVTLLNMIVNGGQHEGQNFLQAQHAALLCRSQSANLAHPNMLAGCEYSLGAADVTDPDLYREQGTGSDGPKHKLWWGGSTNTYFFYVPDRKRIGVMLANTFPFGHKGAVFKFGRLAK